MKVNDVDKHDRPTYTEEKINFQHDYARLNPLTRKYASERWNKILKN